MEMELNKRKINFLNCNYQSSTIHEECGELIIPDSSPDMVRIISVNGRVHVKEKNQIDGRVLIKGTVNGCVLYVAEGEENNIRKISFDMPFNHNFELEETNTDAKCSAVAELVSAEGREINSRKIALRAHIAIDVKVYGKNTFELTEDVSKYNGVSVEIKKVPIDFCVPVCVKERSFTIIDDIEVPQSQPAIENLLDSEVELQLTDTKIIGNKAVLKGVAHIKYTYLSKEGTILCATHNLPYSQIIEIDDAYDDSDLSAKMSIRACDIEPSHDMTGDVRYISVNVLVDTTITVCFKCESATIEDLYSTTHVVESQFEDLSFDKSPISLNRRVSVNESIETVNNVKKIIDTKITTDVTHYDKGKLKNTAQIQIMYVAEDNCFYSVEKKCGIECELDVQNGAKIECVTEISGVSASGIGNKISAYFMVDYDIEISTVNKIRNLKALNITGERKKNNEAAVIVKHVYSEQSIWNLAKKYNTTVEEIAAANCLEFSETVAAGSMLLIPCEK